MTAATLGILTIIAVEILQRGAIEKQIRQISIFGQRARHVVASPRISDHWKEKVLLVYAGRIFGASLFSLITLILAVLPAACVVMGTGEFGAALAGYSLSLSGLLLATLVAILYLCIKGVVTRAQS